MPDLDNRTAKTTVLVVDDSPDNLRLMNGILKKKNPQQLLVLLFFYIMPLEQILSGSKRC